MKTNIHRCLVALATAAMWSMPCAFAATMYTETFNNDAAQWDGRDAIMVVTHDAGVGHPAGSLAGTFAAQGLAVPETDAFRASGSSSGGAFTGDYWLDVPGFTGWTFDFYAADVLPSDMLVRFGDGQSTFMKSFSSQVSQLDSWQAVSISLSYSGWIGGNAATFSNTLSNVTFIDVQITRTGAGTQTFYLDNFALHQNSGGGGDGGSAVPEPTSAMLLLLGGGAVTRLLRIRARRQRLS